MKFLILICLSFILFTSQTLTILSQSCDTDGNAFRSVVLGEQLLNQANYSDSIDQFDCAIQQNPELAVAYIGRGLAYYFLSDFDFALENYTTAIELDDQQINGWNNRGWLYISLYQPEKALSDFEKALTINNQYALSLSGLAEAYYQLGDLENALVNWEASLNQVNDIAIQQRIKDVEAQLAVNDDACDLTIDSFEYSQQAYRFVSTGQFADALQPAHCVVLATSDSPTAYANRGNIYFQLGNYSDALTDLNNALALFPNHYNALPIRGIIYTFYGQYDLAIADLHKAVVIGGNLAGDADALNHLAYSYLQLGDSETAFFVYERLAISIGIDRLDDITLRNIELVETALNQQVAESLTCMGETHSGDVRKWGKVYEEAADRAYRTGDLELALAYIDCAILWMPYNYEFLTKRAELQLESGNDELAITDIEEAIAYNPDFSLAYASFGFHQYRQGNVDDALNAYNRALDLDSKNGRAILRRADLQYELGLYDEALADYRMLQQAGIKHISRLPGYVQTRIDELST